MRKRTNLFFPCLLAILSGCSWDSSLYDKFVGDEGIVVSCVGECDPKQIEMERSKCTGDGLVWFEDRCINDANGAVLENTKDEGSCKAKQAHWEPAHCEVTSEFGCFHVNGKWTPYTLDLLDVGNGEYIRMLAKNKYVCGKFDEVLNATMAIACPVSAVTTFETALQYNICPKNAYNCTQYKIETVPDSKDENGAIIVHAMCSSCAEGMAVCYENSKFQCVDLNTNANHCGICGNKCESTKESCIDGQCIELKCDIRCDDANHTCINPQDNATCGATCKDPKGTRCDTEKGITCTKDKTSSEDNPTYQCSCASGITNKDEYCVNPAANETCGATQANPNGTSCPTGLACRPKANGNSYECICAKGWEVTCHVDGSDFCIDPTNDDKHCNATTIETACTDNPKYQCSPSQQCVNSTCVCREGFAACDNKCIDGSMHDDHCGAKGKCNSQAPDSDDYQGKACGEHAYCSQSQCFCDKNYIMCNSTCISPSANETCGASLTAQDNVCNMGKDCTTENRKSCQKVGDTYQCVCDAGYIECDDQCIDPMTNSQYCGAKEDCKGNNKGQKCDMICSNGACGSNCPDENTFCKLSSTEKSCISQSFFHLAIKDKNCTECSPEYCQVIDYKDDFFHEDRCKTLDNSNKLHTENHCSQCNDKCRETYKCLPSNNGEYHCSCPNGFTECNRQCFNLEQIHKTDCNTCEEGWTDCNGKAEDGCETHIWDDKNNCGQCENNCEQNLSSLNVSGIKCESGECKYSSCHTGYGNCDQKKYNGCETNLTSDANNCGNCGYYCNGYNSNSFSCKNSQCCLKSGYNAYSYHVCCDKKYKRWSNSNQAYQYKCATTKPSAPSDWVEVQQ